MCVPMVKYEMLGLAAKYGLSDERCGLSTQRYCKVMLCAESSCRVPSVSWFVLCHAFIMQSLTVDNRYMCFMCYAAPTSKISFQDWAWHHHSVNGCTRSWHWYRLRSQHAGACPAICRGLLRSPTSATQYSTICPVICVSVAGRRPCLITTGLRKCDIGRSSSQPA